MALVLRIVHRLARWLVYAMLVVVVAIFAAIGALETGWAKNAIRSLIVRQANQYLTATLEIDALSGSFLRGITLEGVRLSRNGEPLVGIDRVSLAYSIRELFDRGTTIQHIEIAGLRVVAARQADGRWNLGSLIKRDASAENRSGPGRPLHLRAVEISRTSIAINEELVFGPAHLSTTFEDFGARFTFDYEPVRWRLTFAEASWQGRAPDLRVAAMTGTIAYGSVGWALENLHVTTPASELLVDGTIDRRTTPSELHFSSEARRFSMAEWTPTVPVLAHMAIDARFKARLDGPVNRLSTDLDLDSNGGHVQGTVLIDTTTPQRKFDGRLTLARLDLAPWLGHPEDPSDISGLVTFAIAFKPGDRFPQGPYSFDGAHASFREYEADDVQVRGTVTQSAVLMTDGIATAYGSNVRLAAGSIKVDSPYAFAFAGRVDGVDLRQLPKAVPVPHVASALHLDYDVTGQFSMPFLRGQARFHESEFLGAAIGEGATGSIDTSASPIQYAGEGDLRNVDLHRFGEGLDVAWLREPRYAGTLRGHFAVDGRGSGLASLELRGGGHVDEAVLFGGVLRDGAVTIGIHEGSLDASYDGALDRVNPSLAVDDSRFDARLTGRGRGHVTVRDLLVRSPSLADYAIDATGHFTATTVRGVAIESGDLTATMRDGILALDTLHAVGPAGDVQGKGRLALDGERDSEITYEVSRASLQDLKELHGRDLSGLLSTKGVMTGPTSRLRLIGEGTVTNFAGEGVSALGIDARYDASIVTGAPDQSTVAVEGQVSLARAFGQEVQTIAGQASYDAGEIEADLRFTQENGVSTIAGRASLDRRARAVTFRSLVLSRGRAPWRLDASSTPVVSWDERGFTIRGLSLTDSATAAQHVTANGTWFPDGGGTLLIEGRHIALEALIPGTGETRYGGFLDVDATIAGSRARPRVTSRILIVEGRVWRTQYERLAGTIEYAGEDLRLDLRLDQSPGNYMTAAGTVPIGLVVAGQPERPIDLAIASSSINLGLIEGTTDVIRRVSGVLQINARIVGTTTDPHVDGRVDITDAAFIVTPSGSRYKNGRVALKLGVDRVTVEALHIEDNAGHPLDVSGSLATHELRVSDLAIDAKARAFEVLRNEFGRVDVDADLTLRGQFETPLLAGRVTISGGQLNVESILDRTMLQPYSTRPETPVTSDAIAALNPWDRLGLDLELHVPGTLRIVGDNVQLTPGTPLGFGDIRLRAIGDLFFYKGPGKPVYITGSLDSISGTYAFQGRRFDLDPFSSINFRGDLNPELFVMVTRQISGVDTRVTIAGPLSQPELRLSSTPPLDQSDILSLIVFNTSANDLSALEQQQLAVRAGTLAAGFIAAPIMSAIERSIGLETLEIEPGGGSSGGTRVTVGEEIAPGLMARFSRQFGGAEYDEAQLEYMLSRILRIRATFSDASALAPRQAFRRVERAGIDLLFFFSF